MFVIRNCVVLPVAAGTKETGGVPQGPQAVSVVAAQFAPGGVVSSPSLACMPIDCNAVSRGSTEDKVWTTDRTALKKNV